MYMALLLFNLHLQCALLQFNFPTLLTSSEKTVTNHAELMKEQKILKPLAVLQFRPNQCACVPIWHTFLVALSLSIVDKFSAAQKLHVFENEIVSNMQFVLRAKL